MTAAPEPRQLARRLRRVTRCLFRSSDIEVSSLAESRSVWCRELQSAPGTSRRKAQYRGLICWRDTARTRPLASAKQCGRGHTTIQPAVWNDNGLSRGPERTRTRSQPSRLNVPVGAPAHLLVRNPLHTRAIPAPGAHEIRYRSLG